MAIKRAKLSQYSEGQLYSFKRDSSDEGSEEQGKMVWGDSVLYPNAKLAGIEYEPLGNRGITGSTLNQLSKYEWDLDALAEVDEEEYNKIMSDTPTFAKVFSEGSDDQRENVINAMNWMKGALSEIFDENVRADPGYSRSQWADPEYIETQKTRGLTDKIASLVSSSAGLHKKEGGENVPLSFEEIADTLAGEMMQSHNMASFTPPDDLDRVRDNISKEIQAELERVYHDSVGLQAAYDEKMFRDQMNGFGTEGEFGLADMFEDAANAALGGSTRWFKNFGPKERVITPKEHKRVRERLGWLGGRSADQKAQFEELPKFARGYEFKDGAKVLSDSRPGDPSREFDPQMQTATAQWMSGVPFDQAALSDDTRNLTKRNGQKYGYGWHNLMHVGYLAALGAFGNNDGLSDNSIIRQIRSKIRDDLGSSTKGGAIYMGLKDGSITPEQLAYPFSELVGEAESEDMDAIYDHFSEFDMAGKMSILHAAARRIDDIYKKKKLDPTQNPNALGLVEYVSDLIFNKSVGDVAKFIDENAKVAEESGDTDDSIEYEFRAGADYENAEAAGDKKEIERIKQMDQGERDRHRVAAYRKALLKVLDSTISDIYSDYQKKYPGSSANNTENILKKAKQNILQGYMTHIDDWGNLVKYRIPGATGLRALAYKWATSDRNKSASPGIYMNVPESRDRLEQIKNNLRGASYGVEQAMDRALQRLTAQYGENHEVTTQFRDFLNHHIGNSAGYSEDDIKYLDKFGIDPSVFATGASAYPHLLNSDYWGGQILDALGVDTESGEYKPDGSAQKYLNMMDIFENFDKLSVEDQDEYGPALSDYMHSQERFFFENLLKNILKDDGGLNTALFSQYGDRKAPTSEDIINALTKNAIASRKSHSIAGANPFYAQDTWPSRKRQVIYELRSEKATSFFTSIPDLADFKQNLDDNSHKDVQNIQRIFGDSAVADAYAYLKYGVQSANFGISPKYGELINDPKYDKKEVDEDFKRIWAISAVERAAKKSSERGISQKDFDRFKNRAIDALLNTGYLTEYVKRPMKLSAAKNRDVSEASVDASVMAQGGSTLGWDFASATSSPTAVNLARYINASNRLNELKARGKYGKINEEDRKEAKRLMNTIESTARSVLSSIVKPMKTLEESEDIEVEDEKTARYIKKLEEEEAERKYNEGDDLLEFKDFIKDHGSINASYANSALALALRFIMQAERLSRGAETNIGGYTLGDYELSGEQKDMLKEINDSIDINSDLITPATALNIISGGGPFKHAHSTSDRSVDSYLSDVGLSDLMTSPWDSVNEAAKYFLFMPGGVYKQVSDLTKDLLSRFVGEHKGLTNAQLEGLLGMTVSDFKKVLEYLDFGADSEPDTTSQQIDAWSKTVRKSDTPVVKRKKMTDSVVGDIRIDSIRKSDNCDNVIRRDKISLQK